MIQNFVNYSYEGLDLLLSDVLLQLKGVDQGLPLTTWNEAYAYLPSDKGAPRIVMTYKLPQWSVSEKQWIDFSNVSFDCDQAVKMWWLEMNHVGGDQTAAWISHSRQEQEKLINQQSSMFSPDKIKLIVDYPFTKTTCLGSSRVGTSF